MGVTVNYPMWVERIREEGSVHLPVTDLPAELAEFRRELRRAGRAAGIRVLTSASGEYFIAWDPDHEVSPERLRAAMDAITLAMPATAPDCPVCGTRCSPAGKAWVCRSCGLSVIS